MARTSIQEYADLLSLEYPLQNSNVRKHPRMSNSERAKIFAPFAALKGYEEAIAAKQHILVSKITLTEEARNELDRKLSLLTNELSSGNHPVVEVVYFEKSPLSDSEDEGNYVSFTGMVAKYFDSAHTLQIVDRKIELKNIRSLSGDIFTQMEL